MKERDPYFEKRQPEKVAGEETQQSLERKKDEFWKEWEKLINEDDPSDIKRMKELNFRYFYDAFFEAAAKDRTPGEIEAQFFALKRAMEFVYGLPSKFQELNSSLDDYEYEREGWPTREFTTNLHEIILSHKDAESIEAYFYVFQNCFQKKESESGIKYSLKINPKLTTQYLSFVGTYARRWGLTKDGAIGFTNKFFPAITEKKDLQRIIRGVSWGAVKKESGEYSKGLADFVGECYACKVNPQNINSLLMSLKEVPATEAAKLEQNRKDGVALTERGFGTLRDLIHDQHPLVPDIIRAMLEYYETHDKSVLEPLLSQTGGYGSKETRKAIYDLSKYDEETLEILRRLAKNTEKINESSEPPETSDAELNTAIKELAKEKKFVPKELLQKTLDIVNSKLETMTAQGEVGIEPNMILAVAWLEGKAYRAIRDMDYETQLSAFKQPWFHSILKFQELTASARDFNKEEFDSFIKKLKDCKTMEEAYRLVIDRILTNLSELAQIYQKTSKAHITGALWSGNIADALIELTELKEASTSLGKKFRKEKLTGEYRE